MKRSISKGDSELCASLERGKEVLADDIFYVEKDVEDSQVEVALQYNDGFAETIKPFANNVLTPDGGDACGGIPDGNDEW